MTSDSQMLTFQQPSWPQAAPKYRQNKESITSPVAKMKAREPRETAAAFELLWQRVAQLHLRWDMYVQLFRNGRSEPIIGNNRAFFTWLRFILLSDVVLSLARLTDPPNQGPNKNLVLRRLIPQSPSESDLGLISELNTCLTEIDDQSASFRIIRNKALAHDDLDVASESLFMAVDLSEVDLALGKIRDFMNLYQLHFRDSTTAYESVVTTGVNGLLYSLKKSALFDAAQKDGLIPREYGRFDRDG